MTDSSSRSTTLSPPPKPPIPQPHHFYGHDDDSKPFTSHSTAPSSGSPYYIHPSDDPLATRGIPVFRPSMAEFHDFESYVSSIEPWGMASGIIKIIPPKEWSDSLPSVKPMLPHVRLRHPIEQNMEGRSGRFNQQNVEKRRIMTVREWAELCHKEEHRAPAYWEAGHRTTGRYRTQPNGKKESTVEPKLEVADQKVPEKGSGEGTPVPQPAASSEAVSAQSSGREEGTPSETADADQANSAKAAKQEAKEAREAAKAALDAEFVKNFDPVACWLPPDTQPEHYTPEFCKVLEHLYWRNCGIGKAPWYGADMSGSLFTEETTEWNVASLTSALSRLLGFGSRMPGVNTPYLYFGMWRATFAWHVEDMDLFSINYIHWGAPKFWYAIPQARSVAFEGVMKSLFPGTKNQCPQFLRHKSYLVSPTLLKDQSCKPNTLVQHAGEFVITFPRGYHAGFNLGLNCAESVNFALESWLDLGRKAGVCQCVSDSVRIDVDALLLEREKERESGIVPVAATSSRPPRKRKMVTFEYGDEHGRVASAGDQPAKKPRKSNEVSGESGGDLDLPCCLCPSTSLEGLRRVHDPPNASFIGIKPKRSAGGKLLWRAHESCALVIPETWVDEVDDPSGGPGAKERVIFGVDSIVADRWNLRCISCTRPVLKSHGALIQCARGKCSKALHVSCAAKEENGVKYKILEEVEKEVLLLAPDASSKPVQESDTGALSDKMDLDTSKPQARVIKTIKKLTVEVLCPQHNPAVLAAKKAEKSEQIKRDVKALQEGCRLRIRVSSGLCEVTLVKIHEDRGTLEVIWDEGSVREFKWGSIVWGATPEGLAVGQKPSVAAPPGTNPPRSRPAANKPRQPPTYPYTAIPGFLPNNTAQPYYPPYAPHPQYAVPPYLYSGQFSYPFYGYPYASYIQPTPGVPPNPSASTTPAQEGSNDAQPLPASIPQHIQYGSLAIPPYHPVMPPVPPGWAPGAELKRAAAPVPTPTPTTASTAVEQA